MRHRGDLSTSVGRGVESTMVTIWYVPVALCRRASIIVKGPHPGREGAPMSTTQMAREIAEQPAAVRRTLDALMPLRPQLAALAADRRRVLFAARGTSDHA